MISILETVFDLLFNALLQIGFLAIIAAVFSHLVAKAKAKHQHLFYLAVLLLCVALPVINTFWRFPWPVVGEKSEEPVLSDARGLNQGSWIRQGHSTLHRPFIISPGL